MECVKLLKYCKLHGMYSFVEDCKGTWKVFLLLKDCARYMEHDEIEIKRM
jgi:hypothetical protein